MTLAKAFDVEPRLVELEHNDADVKELTMARILKGSLVMRVNMLAAWSLPQLKLLILLLYIVTMRSKSGYTV